MEVLPLDIDPDAHPVRRRTAQTYLAGAEFVVASQSSGDYLALNETASALWERCDGSLSVAAIAGVLASAFGKAEAEVLADIRATLSDFHGRDLVSLHLPERPGLQEPPEGLFHITFYQHRVEVQTDDPGVAKNVRRIFGGMLGRGGGTCVAGLAVLADGDRYRTVRDGAEQGVHATLRSAVTWIKKEAIHGLMGARPDLLWLHAGAAATEGKVLFCLGPGGSGKSTLVMSLVESGWAYLSDDVIAYDPVTGGALPFPLAPFYRVWNDEVVDDIRELSKVRYETSPDDVSAAALPVSALVFPTFSAEGPASGARRGAASATVALADQTLNVRHYAGDPLQSLAELASRAPAFDVVHTPDAPPVEVVRPLLNW